MTIPNPLLALNARTNLRRRLAELEQAWERYVSGQGLVTGVRPVVADSWQRCRQAGTEPLQPHAPTRLDSADLRSYRQEHPLHAALEPLMPELDSLAADSGHLIVVTDAQGVILRSEGDPATRRKAERMNFAPGADWSEASAGTNAIGTALATRQPVQILAAEHFCQVVHPWTCAAAVVHDPVTQEVLGVIDMTGLRQTVHPHSLAAVMGVARAVEEQLRQRWRDLELVLWNEYLKESGRAANGLAALDPSGRAVAFSPWLAEQRLVDHRGYLTCLPSSLTESKPREPMELETEGARGERLKVFLRPVWKGARLAGYVVRVVPLLRTPGAPVTPARHTFATILGQSPAFRKALDRARQAAEHDLPVLLLGESGTGKEVLAQAIHAASRRSNGPFVAVNCAAIPPSLLAAELFGYDPGAFTGARREGYRGKFEQAQGGTLFLDEIGDMPPESQALLLRVLEEKTLVRIGGSQTIRLDVRVIAATNADLEKRIADGRFRADLYYRLSVWPVHLPPLRERKGDIAVLFPALLAAAREQLGRSPLTVDPTTLAVLEAYPWPGNVRELKNLAFQVALQAEGPVVFPQHLPEHLFVEPHLSVEPPAHLPPGPQPSGPQPPGPQPSGLLPSGPRHPQEHGAPASPPGRLRDAERELMLRTLAECGGNVTEAARRLGIHRTTIYRKLGPHLGRRKAGNQTGLSR